MESSTFCRNSKLTFSAYFFCNTTSVWCLTYSNFVATTRYCCRSISQSGVQVVNVELARRTRDVERNTELRPQGSLQRDCEWQEESFCRLHTRAQEHSMAAGKLKVAACASCENATIAC